MNFSFGKRLEQVDWRKLASVDIDRVSREMDVKTLQENILHVTYCNIEAEFGIQAFDPNYVKLFRLAQLIIEYILHSQEYLSFAIEEEQKKVQEAVESAQEAKRALAEKEVAYNRLKKEVRKQKEWIAEYQLLMRAGASGIHKCHVCAKTFVSQEYLMGHISRRHGDQPVHMNGVLNSAVPVKTISVTSVEQKPSSIVVSEGERSALLDEMQQIKERLRSTERELANEKHARESQLEKERDQLRKEQQKITELEENYEQWKGLEQEKHKKEMSAFKKSLVQELHALQMQKESVSQALSELEQKMSTRPSMIGSIQDEDETDAPHRRNREENNKQMMEMVESQLGQMKAQTQQDLHKELQKLQQKWKSKEQKTQQEHRDEMQKFQDLLSQHEENLKNEQLEKERMSQGYEEKIMKLSQKLQEHGKALENQKAASDKQLLAIQSQDKQYLAIPPVPQREPLIQESFQRERARSPDKSERAGDTMTLYVSSNPSKKQYRLWRQSADGSNEWSDKLAFGAYPKSTASFSYPLYVYTAGGSPYWRQYISQSNQPPSPEYRLDYIFYTSRVARPGTVQLHVLEAGSIPVIKSCVSLSDSLPGWKDKGLTFHAMKSSAVRSSLTGVSLSGSWDMGSTLTEDKDDAEDDTDDASISESERIKQTPEPPKVEVHEDDDESSDSAEEIKELTSGLSSSDWGTATLEPGEFHPLSHNPLITSRFNLKEDDVNGCRQEVVQKLEQRLIQLGMSEGEEKLSSKKLEARMAFFRTDRQSRIKKVRNFLEIREGCAQELDQIVKKTYRNSLSPREQSRGQGSTGPPKSKSPTNRPPKFKTAATAARTTAALVLPSRKTPTRLSSGSTSGGDWTLSGTSVTDQSFSGTSVTEQTLSESEDDDDDDDDELTEGSRIRSGKYEEEGDSEWDTASEEAFHPTKTVPKGAVKIPSQHDDSDFDSDDEQVAEQPPRVRAPSGERVKELAASLESSLSLGSLVKKPAGGVALLQQSGSQHQQPQVARRSAISQPEDDDSDFSLTSDEDDNGTSAQRGANTGTSVKNPVNPRASVASQRQPPSSAVRDFTDDFSDFDDDDDLDVQHIT